MYTLCTVVMSPTEIQEQWPARVSIFENSFEISKKSEWHFYFTLHFSWEVKDIFSSLFTSRLSKTNSRRTLRYYQVDVGNVHRDNGDADHDIITWVITLTAMKMMSSLWCDLMCDHDHSRANKAKPPRISHSDYHQITMTILWLSTVTVIIITILIIIACNQLHRSLQHQKSLQIL